MRLNVNRLYAIKYSISVTVHKRFINLPIPFPYCFNIFVNYNAKILLYLCVITVVCSSKRFSEYTLDRHQIGETIIIQKKIDF